MTIDSHAAFKNKIQR
jgi:hypothetical protein